MSGVSSACNPALVNTMMSDRIFEFFRRSCDEPELTAEKFWLERIAEKEMVEERKSEDEKTNDEVLVTNRPLSSRWIPDNMVCCCRVVVCCHVMLCGDMSYGDVTSNHIIT